MKSLNNSLFEKFEDKKLDNLSACLGGLANGTNCGDGPSDTKTWCGDGDTEITTMTDDCSTAVDPSSVGVDGGSVDVSG